MAPDRLDQAWMRLMALLAQRRDALFAHLRSLDLNPPHGFTVQLLASGPKRMRDIADSLNCDASYVTSIVDRLEAAGLVERRASKTDRRVKEIALTAKGQRLSKQLEALFAAAPPELQQLNRAQREQFVELMEKLVPAPIGSERLLRPPR